MLGYEGEFAIFADLAWDAEADAAEDKTGASSHVNRETHGLDVLGGDGYTRRYLRPDCKSFIATSRYSHTLDGSSGAYNRANTDDAVVHADSGDDAVDDDGFADGGQNANRQADSDDEDSDDEPMTDEDDVSTATLFVTRLAPQVLNLGPEMAVHPEPALVETQSLASVSPPPITYNLRIWDRMGAEGLRNVLSGLQLEAVAYACQAHEQMLGDGKTRMGFALGDGTGKRH